MVHCLREITPAQNLESMEKPGCLLIAETGSDLSGGLNTWARENGHQIIEVNSLKDLLIALQKEKIRVLVMDACLPPMGYETISIIKGLCQKLPIIVTAAENNPEQEALIRQKGIFYYHVQSFGLD